MPYSTDLFDLIQSLSRTEKAYIKKYAYKQDKNEGNIYWQLFDLIDKQKEYDEEKLLKKFRNHKMSKQFAATKNYLYNLIVRSLTDYDKNKDVEFRLMEMIKEIKSLRRRSLHVQAYKKLETAKKLALKEKEILLYRRLLKLELFLLPFHQNNFDKRVFIYSELKRVDDTIVAGRVYNELYSRWMKAESEIGLVARNENNLVALEELLEEPILQDESHAISFNTRFQFNELHWRYYVYQDNPKQALQYAQQMLGLFGEEPEYIKINPIAYLMSLDANMNCLSSLGDLVRFEEIADIFRKAREHPFIRNLQQSAPGLYYGLEGSLMSAYTRWKAYKKAFLNIPELEVSLSQYHQTPAIVISNQYLIAVTYFYNAQLESALDKVLDLMQDKRLEEFSDLACFTRILHLILHFELGNELLVSYNIRNTYRYLLKRKRLYKVENIILRFLRKTPNILSQKDLLKELKRLQMELQNIALQTFEKQAFAYFNFIDWIESKLQRMSILKIVEKEKHYKYSN